MQRSKYKDQKYFKKYIDFLNKSIKESIEKINKNIGYPSGGLPARKRDVSKDFLELVELKYSAGYPIYSLKSDVINSIKYLTEGGWDP